MNIEREAKALLPKRCLDIDKVSEKTTWSRAAIHALGDKDSDMYDPSWPLPVRLGRRKSVWIESEIDAWIESKVTASRDAGRCGGERPTNLGSSE